MSKVLNKLRKTQNGLFDIFDVVLLLYGTYLVVYVESQNTLDTNTGQMWCL